MVRNNNIIEELETAKRYLFGKKRKGTSTRKTVRRTITDSWKEPTCPSGQKWNQYFERCDSAFGKRRSELKLVNKEINYLRK